MGRHLLILLIAGGVLIILCCCTILIAGGGAYYLLYTSADPQVITLSAVPFVESPTPSFTLTPSPHLFTPIPTNINEASTLDILENSIVPQRDLFTLACGFKGICGIPKSLPAPSAWLEVGEKSQFWLTNTDTNIYSRINATLRYVTPHAYLWIEDGLPYNYGEAKRLLDTFESDIYPTNREFFGSEWSPGVDGDPHLYIFYVKDLGYGVAGLFNTDDEYPPEVSQYSNAHESFYIDSVYTLGDEYVYGTLAHEFQHMIHWKNDLNEGSLLNEGFSELASFLNGYNPGGFDYIYSLDPDISLTDWVGASGGNGVHYGANFLFVTYFLDRFGENATKTLISNPLNDLESIDDTFQQLNITDPITGRLISADDFFMDWTLANYIHDSSVGDGRYFYNNYPASPTTSWTEEISACPQAPSTRTVHQYGVDYILFTCPGEYVIDFTGTARINLLPADPHSGSFAFWSNKGDESDMTLTRKFDFTGVTAPIQLSYWVWYDLETDYDFAYLEASTDGTSWKILETPLGTSSNPTGNAYGWGYTGQTNGWRQEIVDISEFAGKVIWLRFEYITDAAVTGNGMLVDDISIPSIGYFNDFESGNGDWDAAGFVRIQNNLPQNFHLATVTHTTSGTIVEYVPVSANGTAKIPIHIGGDVKDITLVVAATTRFTLEKATYLVGVR